MVDWVSFAVNALVPTLIGLVGLLSVLLYYSARNLSRRIPTKEEAMDMGYTLINAVVTEKMEAFGIKPPGEGPNPPAGPGRPGEGLFDKLLWYANNTTIGREIAGRIISGFTGGRGETPDYYRP